MRGAGRGRGAAGWRGAPWARLLAAWDVRPGSDSERALAAAVLLDAPRHAPAVRRAAAFVLGGRLPDAVGERTSAPPHRSAGERRTDLAVGAAP